MAEIPIICQGYRLYGPNANTRCTHPAKWDIHCLPKEWNKNYVCDRHVAHWAKIGGAHPITQTHAEWKQEWDASLGGPTTPEQAYKEWYEAVHTNAGKVKRPIREKLFADAQRSLAL